MRIVVGGRQYGKTRKMLEWMTEAPEDTVRVFVSHTSEEAMRVLRLAREMELNLESWQFIGMAELTYYNPFPMRAAVVRNFEFGFDNVDLVLQEMVRYWPVTMATMTGESETLTLPSSSDPDEETRG